MELIEHVSKSKWASRRCPTSRSPQILGLVAASIGPRIALTCRPSARVVCVRACCIFVRVQDILSAVWHRMRQLFGIALMLLVLVYCYAVLSFVFFRNLDVADISGRALVSSCAGINCIIPAVAAGALCRVCVPLAPANICSFVFCAGTCTSRPCNRRVASVGCRPCLHPLLCCLVGGFLPCPDVLYPSIASRA